MLASKKQSVELISRWAQGRLSLREIKNYSDDELYAISHVGYFLLMQGKNQEARTLFEGLVAIDPRNDYYYRALGVIFQKLGQLDKAIRQFGYAIKVNPTSPYAYVNRAEIFLSLKEKAKAQEDLRSALARVGRNDASLSKKAWALLDLVACT